MWKGEKTGEPHKRHAACPGLGLFPPHQLLGWCFALCFPGVSLFDHFSETKVLHLTYDQVIVRFLSLLLMTMLQWFMILRNSGIKKVRFIHSPILKTHTWNIPFKKIEATKRKWNHTIKYRQFPIWSPQKAKPGKFFDKSFGNFTELLTPLWWFTYAFFLCPECPPLPPCPLQKKPLWLLPLSLGFIVIKSVL